MQGTFLGTEGTMELIEFVSQFVVDQDGEREFVLYTTPPKQNLANQTFLKQKLMPAAVVYFAWTDSQAKDSYLTPEAKASASQLGKDGKHLTTFSNTKPLDYQAAVQASNKKEKEEAAPKKKKGGVPSWLKLGK